MLRTTARRIWLHVLSRILTPYITGQFLHLGKFFGIVYKPWEFLMKLDLSTNSNKFFNFIISIFKREHGQKPKLSALTYTVRPTFKPFQEKWAGYTLDVEIPPII